MKILNILSNYEYAIMPRRLLAFRRKGSSLITIKYPRYLYCREKQSCHIEAIVHIQWVGGPCGQYREATDAVLLAQGSESSFC